MRNPFRDHNLAVDRAVSHFATPATSTGDILDGIYNHLAQDCSLTILGLPDTLPDRGAIDGLRAQRMMRHLELAWNLVSCGGENRDELHVDVGIVYDMIRRISDDDRYTLLLPLYTVNGEGDRIYQNKVFRVANGAMQRLTFDLLWN